MIEPGRYGESEQLEQWPRLAPDDPFDFVCAGCGDCCRNRRDLILSGYDLYRMARWMSLSPQIVAHAFCRETVGEQTCLPTLRLKPDAKTGDCPFFEGNACVIHPARPLACALYPLGQEIDPRTAAVSYYWQLPRCGAAAPEHTLRDYLNHAGISERSGIDVRWAVVCTQLSERLRAAGGAEHPQFAAVVRRIRKALYYDYATRDEFYPQFQQNLAVLEPILQRLL